MKFAARFGKFGEFSFCNFWGLRFLRGHLRDSLQELTREYSEGEGKTYQGEGCKPFSVGQSPGEVLLPPPFGDPHLLARSGQRCT